jgi:hypothetical protein
MYNRIDVEDYLTPSQIKFLTPYYFLIYDPNNNKIDNSKLLNTNCEIYFFIHYNKKIFYGGIISKIKLPIIISKNKHQTFYLSALKYSIFFKRIYTSIRQTKKDYLEDILNGLDSGFITISKKKDINQ